MRAESQQKLRDDMKSESAEKLRKQVSALAKFGGQSLRSEKEGRDAVGLLIERPVELLSEPLPTLHYPASERLHWTGAEKANGPGTGARAIVINRPPEGRGGGRR